MAEPVVVDANPLIAALLGGKALELIADGALELHSPQFTLFEVESYLSALAKKIGRTELQLFETFAALPVKACQPVLYDSQIERAVELIGQRDSDDVHVVALALTLGCPIWTNDRDFKGLPGVVAVTTAELLARR